MDEETYTLRDYLRILRLRRTQLLVTSGAIILITIGVAFGLADIYRSSATILIEQQEIPPELVRSTVTTFADQRLQLLRQRVMTNTNLLEIINKYDLYATERRKRPIEALLSEMADAIKMETLSAEVVNPDTGKPGKATIAFTVSYENEWPRLAQQVANELTSLYLNENLKARRQLTTETSGFLSEEAEKLRARVTGLETELAKFKETNASRLPELRDLNLKLLDRTEHELAEVEREIRALGQRKIYLESELALIDPTLPADPNDFVYTDSRTRVLIRPEERLQLLRTQYLTMAAVYSPEHPDLVKLEKEIVALTEAVGSPPDWDETQAQLAAMETQLILASQKYSAEHPDVKKLQRAIQKLRKEMVQVDISELPADAPQDIIENPTHVQLSAQLNATSAGLSSYAQKRIELQSKLTEFENRLMETPQVERQYRALLRDHENAALKYQEIKAKEMEAQIAQSLEVEQKGERFVLIEPPQLPQEPVRPNRVVLLVLGLVLATGGGLGSVAFSQVTDSTIRGRKDLISLVAVPPLAVVPYIRSPGEVHTGRLRRLLFYGVVLAAMAAVVFLVHHLVAPLDVLWTIMLRRFGIE